jgi:hypothetical protein
MNIVDQFLEIAGEERFKGWPVVEGSVQLGEKIPFFGQTINYELQTPAGVDKYTSILRHFGWVVVVGITQDWYIPTLVQWKPGVNRASWELPPGGIGKTPPDISEEELLEKTKEHYLKETGYGGGDWEYLGYTLIETGKYRGAGPDEHGLKAHMYMAKGLKKLGDARNPEPNEIMETLLVPIRDLRKVVNSGHFLEVSAVVCAHKALDKVGW